MYEGLFVSFLCTSLPFWCECSMMQGRRSRCGRCGGRRTNNMLSLVSKLLNLAVSSQDCTRNDLRRSKIQNFPGGGPPDPLYVTRFARLLHFLVGALRAPLRRLDFVAQKRSPPDQTKIASYGPVMGWKHVLCGPSEELLCRR